MRSSSRSPLKDPLRVRWIHTNSYFYLRHVIANNAQVQNLTVHTRPKCVTFSHQSHAASHRAEAPSAASGPMSSVSEGAAEVAHSAATVAVQRVDGAQASPCAVGIAAAVSQCCPQPSWQSGPIAGAAEGPPAEDLQPSRHPSRQQHHRLHARGERGATSCSMVVLLHPDSATPDLRAPPWLQASFSHQVCPQSAWKCRSPPPAWHPPPSYSRRRLRRCASRRSRSTLLWTKSGPSCLPSRRPMPFALTRAMPTPRLLVGPAMP